MRKRLVRGTVAAVLSVVLVTPMGARPAAAVGITTIVAAVKAVYELYKAFKSGSGMSIEEATNRIITEINTAKTQIIAQVDRVGSAPARSCARAAVIDLADIALFSTDTLQAYARDTTACVTLIKSLIDVTIDKSTVDTLGFALNAAGPVALIARSRAGFSTTALTAELVGANSAVVSRLAPDCRATVLGVGPGGLYPGNTYNIYTECVVYPGVTAFQTSQATYPFNGPPVDIAPISDRASNMTSRGVAVVVLPVLQSL